MAPETRREREWKFREDAFLDIAADMLVHEGYLGLNLDKLAEKAEYAKGTIYQHFHSKEDLILAVVVRVMAHRRGLFERAASFKGRSRERMAAIGIADGIIAQLYPKHFQIEQLIQQPSLWEKTTPARRSALVDPSAHCTGVMEHIVTDAIADGDLPANGPSPKEICFGLWSASLGVHLLAENREFLNAMGIPNPQTTLHENQHRYLDGLHWKPLFGEWHWDDTVRRIWSDVFPDECKRLEAKP